MSNASPGNDPIYKRLYSFARMVEDLLRSLFADADLDADYGTLERLPAEYRPRYARTDRGAAGPAAVPAVAAPLRDARVDDIVLPA